MKKLPYWSHLDLLRFIAVFMVMASHFVHNKLNLFYYAHLGTYGVDIFFTISGFLITYILLNQKERQVSTYLTFKGFYIKRFLRLFPLYYLLLVLTILCELLYKFDVNVTRYWLWYFLYASNFLYVYFDQHSKFFMDPTWSLAVEEQFYIFWPCILILIKSKRQVLYFTIAMILISFLSFVIFDLTNFQGRYKFLPFLNFHTLGAGALLAYVMYYHEHLLKKYFYKRIELLLFFFIIIFLFVLFKNEYSNSLYITLIREIILLFLTILCTLYAVWNFKDNKFITKYLSNKVTIYLGKISYGLYLLHYPITYIFDYYIKNEQINFWSFLQIHPLVHLTIYFMISIFGAYILWNLVEKPILGLKKYYNY